METAEAVLERPTEVEPYSQQRVTVEVDRGYLHLETRNRQEVIREHLRRIDPSLEKWAEKFGPGPNQINDISHPEYFRPEITDDPEELKPEDLVMVHLTDTFPEDGIIRTANHYRPDLLRFTIHFTLNGPVVEEQQFGVGHWERRKYAIFVPFSKVVDRIEGLSTDDTFVLGDLELPEDTLIVSNNAVNFPKDHQKAGKANLALENFGSTPWDLRLAVMRTVLNLGYTPFRQGSHGWIEWSDYPGYQVLNAFTQKHGIPYQGLHSYHWSSDLEQTSLRLKFAKGDNDPQKLQEAIWDAERFLEYPEYKEVIPDQYKNALRGLIEQYQTGTVEKVPIGAPKP